MALESLPSRLVLSVDRALAWGMDPAAREQALAEQVADWEAMAQDAEFGGELRMMLRQLRGVPAAIWWRLVRREVTALPAAAALVLVMLGTAMEAAVPDYPPGHRLSLLVGSAGVGYGAWVLTRSPRLLVSSQWRPVGFIVGVGAAGSAVTFPTLNDWMTYQPEQMHAPAIDLAMQIALMLVAAGCLGLIAASWQSNPRRLMLGGGVAIIAGTLLLAAAQFVWGVRVAPIDLYVTAVSLGTAFGALLFAHMVFRLRRLEIV